MLKNAFVWILRGDTTLSKHHAFVEVIERHGNMLGLAHSGVVLAEISLRSPRKLFIFSIYKNICRIKVSKNILNLILKQTSSLVQTLPSAPVVLGGTRSRVLDQHTDCDRALVPVMHFRL